MRGDGLPLVPLSRQPLRGHGLTGNPLRRNRLTGNTGGCLPRDPLRRDRLAGMPLPLDPLRRNRLPGIPLSRNALPGNRLGRQRLPRRSLPRARKPLRGSKLHSGTGLPDSRLPHTLLLPGTDPSRHPLLPLPGRPLRRNHRTGLPLHLDTGLNRGRLPTLRLNLLLSLRLRLSNSPTPPPSWRARGMRLRRSVIVPLIDRNGIVPPVITGMPTRNTPGNLPRRNRNPGRNRNPRSLRNSRRLRGRSRRNVRRPIGLGRRQREHRPRPRLLRGSPLGRGSQGPAPTPGRLPVLATGVVSTTGVIGGAARGQRGGRQRLPLTTHRHTARRHGATQPRTRSRGPGGMLGRRHHSALGDTPGHTFRVVPGRTLGRPSAPPPGTAGRPVTAGFRSGRLVARPPPAPPGRHRGLTTGAAGATGTTRVIGPRHLALQERVHGGPPGPPPPVAARRRLGQGEFGAATGSDRSRDGTGPAPDGHLQHVRAAAHPGYVMGLQHTTVRPHDPPHDRLVHRVSPAYGPRTSIRTTSPRCAAATTTVLSM